MVHALIVDDVRINRLSLAKAIDPMPAVHAAGAAEALESFFQERPAVILLDLGLPDVDGVTLLKIVRQQDERDGRLTPVVVVSGEGTKERVREIASLNVQGFFVKPVDAAALRELIRSLGLPGEEAPPPKAADENRP